jgi:hypothetical protein
MLDRGQPLHNVLIKSYQQNYKRILAKINDNDWQKILIDKLVQSNFMLSDFIEETEEFTSKAMEM